MTDKRDRICGDGPLLLWYAAGALEEAEAARMAEHVESCGSCQALVRENQDLAELYRSAAERGALHLSAETLLRIASDEPGPEVAKARQHLTACGECREIVSVLERVQKEEESVFDAEPVPRRAGPAWTAIFKAGWMRSPLPAYMLALLLLYPAYRGLLGREPSPSLLPPPLTIVSESERGSAEPPVRIDVGSDETVVTVFVAIAPDRYSYRLELRTRAGRRLFVVEDAQSFDGVGTFALTLPKGFLGVGDYELRIQESERDGAEAGNEYVFPFTVDGH